MEAAEILKRTPLFAEMSDAEMSELALSSRIETFRPGQIILREGHAGAAFFVLVSGKVEVVKRMAGAEPTVVAALGAGDFFGEVSIMKHVARSASVRAVEATECLVIRRLDLDSFIERHPGIAAKVESARAARFEGD